ncbi:MAG TPA: leucyl/phenylalanyl-tRNA--protein transferase [Rhodothermales bacterium]|nr:leucyl/phenylalanyl-tRNA--protein transferase [Rhodothermales bacterium]
MPLTSDVLLYGYRNGFFPMANPDEAGAIYWYAPDPRAILPLDAFHVPGTLARTMRRDLFEVRHDTAFEAVMRACAARDETWISAEIVDAYTALHHDGFAHSVECWQGGLLAGGLYGVAVGGAFFGESMFHHVRDASKVALVHLVAHLRRQGFVLHDTQFLTPHLERFGAVEIPRNEYEHRLAEAVALPVHW